MIIKFVIIDGFWRAFVVGADHLGGMGKTPEEALGWLIFNHPHKFGIAEFNWGEPKPGDDYPHGLQDYMKNV